MVMIVLRFVHTGRVAVRALRCGIVRHVASFLPHTATSARHRTAPGLTEPLVGLHSVCYNNIDHRWFVVRCAADACHNGCGENSRLHSATVVGMQMSSEVSNAELGRWKVQGALTRSLFYNPVYKRERERALEECRILTQMISVTAI